MKVIWKRPDGFHASKPEDYFTIPIGGGALLWLHKTQKESYPFRIAGGWEEEAQTKRLNMLINSLAENDEHLVRFLNNEFSNSVHDDKAKYFADLLQWLKDLELKLKGDTWEIEIMRKALSSLESKLTNLKPTFIEDQ